MEASPFICPNEFPTSNSNCMAFSVDYQSVLHLSLTSSHQLKTLRRSFFRVWLPNQAIRSGGIKPADKYPANLWGRMCSFFSSFFSGMAEKRT